MAVNATLNLSINSTEAAKAVAVLNELTASGVNVQRMYLRMREATDLHGAAERSRTQAMQASALSFQNMFRLAMQLVGAYSALQAVRRAFSDAMTEERVELGLRNITGSAEQARNMIAQLNDYANNSQFGVDKLENDARLLANMGFNAQEVVPTLKALGNEIEATGGSSTDLDEVVKSLARMNDEGQISVFTLRQMEQQGIPAGRILAQALNESVVEVMKDVRSGTLDAHGTLQLLIRGMAEFGNNANNAKDSNYVLWHELINSLQIAKKDFAGFVDNWVGLHNVLQNSVGVVHEVSFALKDIYTYLEGGKPQLQQTQQIVATLATVFRVLILVLEALIALQLLSWAKNLGTALLGVAENLGPLLLIMGAIVAIDFGKWLADNTKAGRDFVIQMKEAFNILNEIRKGVGGTLGDIFSRTEAGAGDSWERMLDRINNIADQANRDMNTPFTAKSKTGSYWDDSVFKNNSTMVGRLLSGGLPSLDLGGNMGGWIRQYSQMLRDGVKVTQDQLSPMDASSAYQLSEQKAEAIQKSIDKLKEEQQVAGETNDIRKMELDILKERQLIGEKVLENSQQARDLLAEYVNEYQKLQAFQELGKITQGIGDAAGKALGAYVSGAKSAKQAIDELLRSLEQLAIQQFVSKPLANLLGALGDKIGGNVIDALFSGSNGGYYNNPGYNSTNASSLYGDSGMEPGVGQALGGVWYRGMRMFADGGTVGSPTFFGMAGGGLGLMGEAGPEAILPLSRGPDGKLGVKGGAGGNQYITMHVYANDADSFKRNGRQIRQHLSGR